MKLFLLCYFFFIYNFFTNESNFIESFTLKCLYTQENILQTCFYLNYKVVAKVWEHQKIDIPPEKEELVIPEHMKEAFNRDTDQSKAALEEQMQKSNYFFLFYFLDNLFS